MVLFAALAWLSVAMAPVHAADDELATIVNQRVHDWQPTADERLLDQVGWAADLMDAQRLAKLHQRPLFLFTYNGSATRVNAIALQRC